MTIGAVKRVATVAVMMTVLAAGAASAVPRGPVAGRRAAVEFRAAIARLGLSADQKDRLRAIRVAERPALEALRARRLASKAELDAALQAPAPDPTAVGSALLKSRADARALRDEARQARARALAVLTPEQRGRLEGFRDGVRARRSRGGA